jgi:O-antigen ligase
VALFGIVQYLTWNGRIYWVRRVPSTSTTAPSGFGPFVNHNHFAGFAEMVIPVAIGLAFWWVLHWIEDRRSPTETEATNRLSRAILVLLAVVAMVGALVLSLSKGGILSALVSGGVLFLILFRRIRPRRLAWTMALVLPMLAALLVVWIGPEPLIRQMTGDPDSGNEASFRVRAVIWRHVGANLTDFLWVGSGLGAFEASFAPLTPPGSQVRWDKAHNDYLQILWETGLIGATIVLGGVLLFVRRAWWPAIHQPRGALDLFRLGLATALLSIAIHSLVDFNLQIGANGFLCALLAGMLVALEHGEDVRADLRPVAPGPPAQ